MKIVIDTSAVMAVLLYENKRDDILNVTHGAELYAPLIIQAEIGNAVSSLMKRGLITLDQGLIIVRSASTIPISNREIDIIAALELSYEYKIYAHDAYFLALCSRMNFPLLTLDKGMKSIAQMTNIKCIEL
jgi:predicted nucleic acid-binding protein